MFNITPRVIKIRGGGRLIVPVNSGSSLEDIIIPVLEFRTMLLFLEEPGLKLVYYFSPECRLCCLIFAMFSCRVCRNVAKLLALILRRVYTHARVFTRIVQTPEVDFAGESSVRSYGNNMFQFGLMSRRLLGIRFINSLLFPRNRAKRDRNYREMFIRLLYFIRVPHARTQTIILFPN